MYSRGFIILHDLRMFRIKKIQGVSLKINALSSWKYPLHQGSAARKLHAALSSFCGDSL